MQSGLELRPEVFDIGRGDHALALILLLQCRRELTDPGDDVGAGCQRETSDIGVTLLRRRTELPHRSKDDYPLPSGTCPIEELDCRARRARICVVGIIDEGYITH